MRSSTETKFVYEFGPFRADPNRNLLLRGADPVTLSAKSFETLLVLLRHGNEIVSKDELMKALWPDTFVDEANLAQHVSVLRRALGETPQDRRYIVTLPGKGYRFAESIRLVPVTVPEDNARPEEQKSPTARRPWGWYAAAGILLLACAGGFAFFRSYRAPALTDSDLVLVADFVNATGEPIFDRTLKQALTIRLAESPYFNVLDDSQVSLALRLMGRAPDERVVGPVARDLCQRQGAKVVLGGSIARIGKKYVIDLDATNCLTGSPVAHQETDAEKQEDVLGKLDGLIPPLRRSLGESMASIEKFDTPIEQATTKSLPALKAYTSGDEKRAAGSDAESIPLYKMAVDLDPDFALAYARLAVVYGDSLEYGLAVKYMQEAFERRGHTSEQEKFYIAAHYYDQFTLETDKAIATYKLWVEVYPHDWIPFNNLCQEYTKIGQLDNMVEAAQNALRLNPRHGLTYAAVVQSYRIAGRYAEAKTIAAKAMAVKLDGFIVHFNLYWIAFAEGDEAAMRREIDWFKGKPRESFILNHQAWAAASLGQLKRARTLFDLAQASALAHGMKGYAASTAIDEAQVEAELGELSAVRSKVKRALEIQPGSIESEAGGALALARAGDLQRSAALANAATGQSPRYLLLLKVSIPAATAAGELSRRNAAAALEDLKPARPFDLGSPGMTPEFVTLYYRGLASLQAGSGKDAAGEFQAIIDHRGVNTISPYWSLARLGLARALKLSGETDKSLAEYREFLALWKDADSDLRLAKEARAEYQTIHAHGNQIAQ
jgi:DNA-binding winged helix-turn-helix (wHTH) protein/tetratricopeptide (TPR) repeat protein